METIKSLIQSELHKFLFISSKYDESFVPSKLIDHEWHQLIKNEKAYEEMCIEKYGKIIFHKENRSVDLKEKLQKYKLTLSFLEKEFGEINHNIWPLPDEKVGSLIADCDTTGTGGPGKEEVYDYIADCSTTIQP